MAVAMLDRRGLLRALIKDGRPLLVLTALALLFSGGFALFLAVVGQFLPHDLAFLGMSAEELCRLGECRVVAFMAHDRATFGGVLIAIGTIYLWLAGRPGPALWQALAVSGVTGFGSAIGVHFAIGYTDALHLAPAAIGASQFAVGLALAAPAMLRPTVSRFDQRGELSRSTLEDGRKVMRRTAAP